MPETKHRTEPASITCSDGVALAGQWVLPLTDESSVTKAIALHPATGVDMNLYRKFAIYLAEHGWPALINQATGPLLSVVFTDDLWANRPAVDVLTDQAVQCDVVKRDIEAGEGTKNGPIGHMGFYRSKNRALWPEVAAWVEAA